MGTQPAWRQFEVLAEKIFTELSPKAVIRQDDHILGKLSGIPRQLDVSIRADLGEYQSLVIVQARDRTAPADVNAVGELAAVIEDVEATNGILVCKGGFTRAAMVYAKNKGISLCNLHDAESRDWNLDIQLPILWTDLLPYLQLSLEAHFDGGDRVLIHPDGYLILSHDQGKTRINVLSTFEDRWNQGLLPREVNVDHSLTSDRPLEVLVESIGGERIWKSADFLASYRVEQRTWLGYFSPDECRGMVDCLDDDSFTASYLPIGQIPTTRDEAWSQIDSPDELAVTIKGSFVTTQGYEVEVGSGSIEGLTMSRINN
jgi:hypothetical protein